MSDIMLEVNDEMQSQQIKALWKKYGQWVIGVAVIAVLGTAVGVFWRGHVNQALEHDTDRLLSVLQQETASDSKKLIKDLTGLQANTRQPLRALINLQEAQRLEQSGDKIAAQKLYQSVMDDKQSPAISRDLARLHYVRLGLVTQQEKPETLLAIIEPLTKENAYFRSSALELKGLLLQQQNKQDEANVIFKALANDAAAPASLRQRAQTLIHYNEGEGQHAQ